MRRRRNDRSQEAREIGLAAAVGLQMAPDRRPVPGVASGHCPVCEAVGRIDMVDTAGQVAYLSCRRCGKEWVTDRAVVRTG
jgi:formate dehydrogenase maturation protein FdhE